MAVMATVVAWAAWAGWICKQRASASYVTRTPDSFRGLVLRETPRERGFFLWQ